MAEEIVDIVVAIDSDSSDECMYVNGKAWKSKGECTVYAVDIADHAAGRLIRFEHRVVDAPDVWPNKLSKLKRAK